MYVTAHFPKKQIKEATQWAVEKCLPYLVKLLLVANVLLRQISECILQDIKLLAELEMDDAMLYRDATKR